VAIAPRSTPTVPLPEEALSLVPLCAIFRRHLKAQGLKYTPERADVLNAIIERDAVFEADQLLVEMRQRGHRVSKATIYRTIRLLQDAGIIIEALFDPRQTHYQLVYGKTPRDFLVCVRTGKCVQFSSPELLALRDRICRENGWRPEGHRFQIYGVSPGAE
jgi:Fur family ferric uptake transcriptional regulator